MNKKILSVVELVSNQKLLPREKIFEALESALSTAIRKKYVQEIDIRVSINRNSGDCYTFRRWMIVHKVQNPTKEITLAAARFENKYAQLSEYIEDKIYLKDFDRIATQTAKKVIIKKVQEAEKSMIVRQFYNLKGKIIKGTVKKIHRDYILLSVNNYVEAILNKINMLPRESFRIGERTFGILYDIRPQVQGIQLFISRIRTEILFELFHFEVPEISENIIEIKSIARNPGLRSKIAVISYDKRLDPIGACIGIKGARVQAVSEAIGGERIDIILWDKNPARFIMNSMAPVNIVSMIIHENEHAMDIAVYPQDLSQAIGRYGHNVRLVSQLSGWNLNIMTVDDLYFKHIKIKYSIKDILIKQLQLNVFIIPLLLREGLFSKESLICAAYSQLLTINYINRINIYQLQDILNQHFAILKKNKKKYIFFKKKTLFSICKKNKLLILHLFHKNIFNLKDLANQRVYNLINMLDITNYNVGLLIMSARNFCWFNN